MSEWAKKSRCTWEHSDGRFIAKFNWGTAGIVYLLYSSRAEYSAGGGDYKSFKKLQEAKS